MAIKPMTKATKCFLIFCYLLAFVTFTFKLIVSRKSTTVPYSVPINITIDTFKYENTYYKYLIKDVGVISIPIEMELQNGEYKVLSESIIKKLAYKFKYEITNNRIVFQQNGLNDFNKESFSTYARIIINTYSENENEHVEFEDLLKLDIRDLIEINNELKTQVENTFRGTGLKLIQWDGVDFVRVNNILVMRINYLRQLNTNPYVRVNLYKFQNKNKIHTLTMSFRQEDSLLWNPLYNKVLNSFKITDY